MQFCVNLDQYVICAAAHCIHTNNDNNNNIGNTIN